MPKRLSNEEKCDRQINAFKVYDKLVQDDFQELIKEHKIKQNTDIWESFEEERQILQGGIRKTIESRNAGLPPPNIKLMGVGGGVEGLKNIIKRNEMVTNWLLQNIKLREASEPLIKKAEKEIEKIYGKKDIIEIDLAELGNVSKTMKLKTKKGKRQQLYILLGIGLIILLLYLIFR